MTGDGSPPDDKTRYTLLERLCSPEKTKPCDWPAFVRIYTPMLLSWAKRQGFQDADAADLTQEVLVKLIDKLPKYRCTPGKRFRDWLFVVVKRHGSDFRQRLTRPAALSSEILATVAGDCQPTEFEEAEYRKAVIGRLSDVVRPDFEERTWAAFTGVVLEGRPAAEVAANLGISKNAVYLAQNRVLTRLREEAARFLA